MGSGTSPGTHNEDRQTRYASSSLLVTIHAAMDWGERVAAQPGSVSSATRTRRGPRLANPRCASRTLLRDPRRRSRATRPTAAWSTARSRAEAERSSFSLQLQPALEAVRHRGKGTVCLAQRRDTRGPQRIELPTATAPLRGGIAHPGFEEALALEPVESGVDGVDRHIPPRARVNLLPDGGSVRSILEAEHTQENKLFEIAEHGCLG